MFKWIIVIVGLGVLLFNIFFFQGSTPKFKSDLPKTDTMKKRGKVKCFIILSLICLAVLLVLFWLLSLML